MQLNDIMITGFATRENALDAIVLQLSSLTQLHLCKLKKKKTILAGRGVLIWCSA